MTAMTATEPSFATNFVLGNAGAALGIDPDDSVFLDADADLDDAVDGRDGVALDTPQSGIEESFGMTKLGGGNETERGQGSSRQSRTQEVVTCGNEDCEV